MMTDEPIRNLFTQIEKVAPFTDEDRAQLIRQIEERSFRKGEVIRGAANLSSYALYLTSGSLRLFYMHKGKEYTAGFTIGEEFVIIPRRLLTNYYDTISVEFMEPSTVIYVPALTVKDMIEKKGVVAIREALTFFNAALVHYTMLMEERMDMLHLNSREKVAWFTARYPRVMEVATMTQVASYLGIAKETLYRIRANNY